MKVRWVGHAVHTGDTKKHTKFWSGYLKERDHSEDLDTDGRKILEWIL